MSIKEKSRREICRFVLMEAWKIYRRSFVSNFSKALALAWRLTRSQVRFRCSKAKGVSFSNAQCILRKIANLHSNNIALGFVRDYNNRFDPNAIKIMLKPITLAMPLFIGYVDKQLASVLSPQVDSGRELIGQIETITGLTRSNGLLGLNFKYVLL